MRHRHTLLIAVALLMAWHDWGQAQSLTATGATFLMDRHDISMPTGRRMNLVCAGKGSPTVIVESGLGSHMLHWQKVAGDLSHLTKTCFYDRAGFGFSDPAPKLLTAKTVTNDLHALLRRAGVTGPVVLVGHSLGGLYATIYANRFPRSVSGMVLIEPSFAEQDRYLSPEQRAQDEKNFKASLKGLGDCAALARSGKLATEAHDECFAFAPNRSSAEKAFLLYQFSRPFRYEAMAAEIEAQHSSDGVSDVNSRFEAATRRKWGNMPLIVLTAERAHDANETPAQRELAVTQWTSWKVGHDRLASKSTAGKSVIVSGTSHFIQIDQPDVVVEAVKSVIGATSQRRSSDR